MASRIESKRTGAQLAAFTGYHEWWASALLKRLGVDWRSASNDEIKRALTEYKAASRARAEQKLKTIVIDGVEVPKTKLARELGIDVSTLRARALAFGSWQAAVDDARRNPGRRAKWRTKKGVRHSRPIEIDGDTRTYVEWLIYVDYSRPGIHKRAKRLGITTTEVIAELARAKRDAEVEATAFADPPARPVPCAPCADTRCRTLDLCDPCDPRECRSNAIACKRASRKSEVSRGRA